MTPIDIEERNIRLPHSIGGSTNVSIAEPPETEGSCCQLGFRRYWLSEIDRKWTDIPLIVCGYVSGLLDGLSFNYWGVSPTCKRVCIPPNTNPFSSWGYTLLIDYR